MRYRVQPVPETDSTCTHQVAVVFRKSLVARRSPCCRHGGNDNAARWVPFGLHFIYIQRQHGRHGTAQAMPGYHQFYFILFVPKPRLQKIDDS